MPILGRNIALGAPLRLSSWRKVAIGTWHRAGDPSVYGMMDVDVTAALAYIERERARTGLKITLTHFFGKVIAETFRRNPQINCILRFGRLYPRENIDVFFQIASDTKGEDLSGATLRNVDRMSVADIATKIQERVENVRKKGDPEFKKMKGLFAMLPGMLAGPLLRLTEILTYALNLWSPVLGSPRDPFGSVMLTNIGSLGLDMAFAPLVPYSRVPIVVALGAVADRPVARNGQVAVAPVLRLCVTFDHRIIDGVHASHMARAFQKILANPEQELGGAKS